MISPESGTCRPGLACADCGNLIRVDAFLICHFVAFIAMRLKCTILQLYFTNIFNSVFPYYCSPKEALVGYFRMSIASIPSKSEQDNEI